MTQTGVRLRVTRPGHYRLAVRYSPYWRAPGICVARRGDGMTELTTRRAGAVALTFDVTVGRALDALRGRTAAICSPMLDDAKGLP
jgi:hypothetical protein